MPPLADSRFEREALVNHAKCASGAASVNLTREKLSNLQFQSLQIPSLQIPSLKIPSRQTASLQSLCAAIGAVFAAADAGSIILAGLLAAEGIAAAAFYLLIGRSFGFLPGRRHLPAATERLTHRLAVADDEPVAGGTGVSLQRSASNSKIAVEFSGTPGLISWCWVRTLLEVMRHRNAL
jgi:hypothetical protein